MHTPYRHSAARPWRKAQFDVLERCHFPALVQAGREGRAAGNAA
jgi:hypothetical protein